MHPGFCSVMLHTPSWGPFPGFSPRIELLTSSAFFTFTKILPKTAETPSSNTISLLLRAPSDRFEECPDKDAADILWRKILEDPRWKTVKDYLGVRSPLHRLDRWCVAWQVEVFTFGCKSTQRAESLNCHIKRHLTARKGYYHIFSSVLHLLSKEGYKLEYTKMVNHRHANHQIANQAFPFYVKLVSCKVTSWAFDRMLQHMNASTAYLVYEYDVSREA